MCSIYRIPDTHTHTATSKFPQIATYDFKKLQKLKALKLMCFLQGKGFHEVFLGDVDLAE